MVLEKLKEIVKQVMPGANVDRVTMDAVLTTDLGIDSLSMMLLAITIEDTFGIRFESTVNFVTVGDICKYIEEHTKG